MLKVVSILMIVFGIIAAVFNVIGIVGGGLATLFGGAGLSSGALDQAEEAVAAVAAAAGTYLLIQCIIGIIASVIETIGGFKGLGAIKEPEKAPSCVKYGVICAILALISIGISVALVGTTIGRFVGNVICSLLIPGLYIYGLKRLSR